MDPGPVAMNEPFRDMSGRFTHDSMVKAVVGVVIPVPLIAPAAGPPPVVVMEPFASLTIAPTVDRRTLPSIVPEFPLPEESTAEEPLCSPSRQ